MEPLIDCAHASMAMQLARCNVLPLEGHEPHDTRAAASDDAWLEGTFTTGLPQACIGNKILPAYS